MRVARFAELTVLTAETAQDARRGQQRYRGDRKHLTSVRAGRVLGEQVVYAAYASGAHPQASGNKIQNLRALDSQLAPLKKLETVYLEGNPCQLNDMTGYRRKIILALPQVKQIDAT